MIFIPFLLFPSAYLLGSASTAVITCRLLKLPDPRTQGSGNPGATNVLRINGKKAALFTLIGDITKGFLPVMIARLFNCSDLICALIGLLAFLGHLYPIFFNFKGGKGVATALGAMTAFSIILGGSLAITWAIIFFLFRYSSFAALVAATLAPVYVLLLGHSAALVPLLIMSGLLIWRHKANVLRLLAGTEHKTK